MKISDSAKLIISIVICQAAGLIGSLAGQDAIPVWYANLEKSSLTPPNFVFPMVWITLYFLMAIALHLVWKKGADKKGVKLALTLFGIQLALNTLWTVFFFGLRDPFLALADIIVLALLILWTTILFYRHNKNAAYLMLPYLAWVSFATYLNYAFIVLNY